ncbi:hypothetical protein Nepgr_000093 [Nepenthes gracilis]|uniref:Uncharacterized protein n=1 Tax=Nepenthes gracilis TaxID=150966 RepID=A0AAD3P5N3_NEPGR|nr:hypothetical protein Nepgr_000093 [Nepenthes gracilis]
MEVFPPTPSGDRFSGFLPRRVTSSSWNGLVAASRQSSCVASMDVQEIRQQSNIFSSCSSAFSFDSNSFWKTTSKSGKRSSAGCIYGREEREKSWKLLLNYLSTCFKAKLHEGEREF